MRKRERRMIESVVGAGQDRLVLVDGIPLPGLEHDDRPDEPGVCMDAHGLETAFLFDTPVVSKGRRRGC
jgi:hypothetical protein